MRIFDENKINEINEDDVDFTNYKLEQGKLFIQHHEATSEVKKQSHYEVIKEYPNGGKDVKEVIDVAPVPAKEAWDEYEDILFLVPLSQQEKDENRKIEIQARLNALSQDFIQSLAGEIVPNIEERQSEFVTLHNELRELLGMSPREIFVEEELEDVE